MAFDAASILTKLYSMSVKAVDKELWKVVVCVLNTASKLPLP